MSTNCAGRHVCEPDHYPSELGESWTCPDCGTAYHAFDVHAEAHHTARMLRHVPPGTIGWTTRKPPPSPSDE